MVAYLTSDIVSTVTGDRSGTLASCQEVTEAPLKVQAGCWGIQSLSQPSAGSSVTGQQSGPELARCRVLGPLRHLLEVFIQCPGQQIEALLHKEKSPAETC